jgi:hypothetical protein
MNIARSVLLASLVVAAACATSSAQVPNHDQIDVDQVMAGLLEDTVHGGAPEGGVIVQALLYPSQFPEGTAELFAERLEELLVTGVGTESFQFTVARFLILAGSIEREVPLANFVDRVKPALRQTKSFAVQEALVEGLRTAADQNNAALALREVAERDSDIAIQAVNALATMGPPGRSVLDELVSDDSVANPDAKAALARARRNR